MIFSQSILTVNDNSGAKKVKCIQVLKASKSYGAKPLDFLVFSVRKVRKNKNVIKGQVCNGLFVRGKKNFQRSDGSSIKFSDNSVVLIDKKKSPIASRMIGVVYKELRYKDYPKVLAIAKSVL